MADMMKSSIDVGVRTGNSRGILRHITAHIAFQGPGLEGIEVRFPTLTGAYECVADDILPAFERFFT